MKIESALLPMIVALALVACSGVAGAPTAIPTIVLGNPAATSVPTSVQSGGVTASGVIVADQEAHMAFDLAGHVTSVKVAIGDQVQAGETLVELEDSTQQIQLEQANLALQELSSPSALAAAQQNVAQDETDIYNFQIALSNLLTEHNNQGLIDNAQAGLVLAQDALKTAQKNFDDTPGDQTRDPGKAVAYQKLYSAQQDYNNALYLYNIYSGKANQPQVDEATAKLALAKAKLVEDRDLVAALTGAYLPANPTGAGYTALAQARFAVQSAQASLNAARLVSPFAGEVASISVSVGDTITPGQVVVVVSDTSHLHVETTDLSERDIPQVKVGQSVTVTVKALNQDIGGKVTAISPLANSLGGDVVYPVIIQLDTIPVGVLSGMSVTVRF